MTMKKDGIQTRNRKISSKIKKLGQESFQVGNGIGGGTYSGNIDPTFSLQNFIGGWNHQNHHSVPSLLPSGNPIGTGTETGNQPTQYNPHMFNSYYNTVSFQ